MLERVDRRARVVGWALRSSTGVARESLIASIKTRGLRCDSHKTASLGSSDHSSRALLLAHVARALARSPFLFPRVPPSRSIVAMGAGDLADEAYDAAASMAPKKRAAVDALWASLHTAAGGAGVRSCVVSKAERSTFFSMRLAPVAGGAGGSRANSGSPAAGRETLAALARLNRVAAGRVAKPGSSAGAKRAAKPADDANWRAMLGGGATSETRKRSKSPREIAASLEAARAAIAGAGGVVRVKAAVKTDGVVSVVETRNFAGKEMEVTKTYAEGSREAKNAMRRDAAAKGGGLDSVLLQMEKTKKLNVLDKSKMDWKEVKDGDAEMEEDLERHKKGKTYLEEQEFLKRAEVREYEIERDARLAGDVRSRGRL